MSGITPEIEAQMMDALAARTAEPEQAAAPEPPAPEEATAPEPEVVEEAPAEPEAPEAPQAVEEDSFIPRADLDSLLDGVEDPAARDAIERAYKSFQGGYTRKTQALAEQRAALSGLDPVQAKQAVEFWQALQTDGAFALEVHEALSRELENAGLTPRQAAQAATEAVSGPPALDPELAALGVDPENPLVQKLQELEQWKASQERERAEWQAQQEQQRRIDEAMQIIERQTLDIRRADPSLSDDDMDVITKLAASTGGNLFEAEEFFKEQRDRLIGSYVRSKAQVPASSNVPAPSVQFAEPPEQIADLDEAHKLAMERYRQIQAQG